MNKYTEPHFAQSALITIDMQNDFTLDKAPAQVAGTKDVISNIAHLLEAYRDRGLLIVHVVRLYLRDGSNADPCRRQLIEEGRELVAPTSTGAELVSELKPNGIVALNPHELLSGAFQRIGANEFTMYKPRWGAFYGTHLEDFLKMRERDTLVFSGCNFPNCPRISMFEASERDFRIVLVTDAVSQLYPKGEEEMKSIGASLLTTKAIEGLLVGE